jgi:hypothetical protein
MYARTVSGANTATTTAAPSSAHPASAVTPLPRVRSRAAVTRCDTGFRSTNDFSHPGSVSAGTNAFDAKVSGNSTIIEMPCTDDADRAITPKNAKIQDSAHALTITSSPAATTPTAPPSGRQPMIRPMTIVSAVAMRYRMVSASSAPASGAIRAMGSDRNRSNTPLSMSSRSWTPVTTDVVMTVCTRMPGMKNGR